MTQKPQETVRLDVVAATTKSRTRNELALNYGPMDESLRLDVNKERLGIELKEHNMFGSAVVKIQGHEEGRATASNQVIFFKNADGTYSIDLKGIEGLGFLFCIEDGNGKLYKPAAEKDGKLVYLGISNIIITQELLQWMKQNNLHFTIVVDAYAPGNLQSDRASLLTSGGTLALPELASPRTAPDHNSDEAVKDLFSQIILVQASSIATISNVTNAYLLKISDAAKNLYLSAVRAAQMLPHVFNMHPRFSFLWFAHSNELELARRQRMLEQSAQRRVQKMLLFDAVVPSHAFSGSGATDNFQQDFAQHAGSPMLSMLGIGSNSSDFDSFGDGFGGSGGERMRSGAKSEHKMQQKNTNANGRVSNEQSNGKISSAANNTRAKASNSQQVLPKSATAISNFQTQYPISEGKTIVQQPVGALQSNAQAVSAHQANMHVLKSQIVNPQTTSLRRDANLQSPRAKAQMLEVQQPNSKAQPMKVAELKNAQAQGQAESIQTIAQTQPMQAEMQFSQAESMQTSMQAQEQAIAHKEQVVQIILHSWQHTQPIAAQRIRPQKKRAGEKILPRKPIIVSSGADGKGNKKGKSMNNEEKETRPQADISEPAEKIPQARASPRRVIPQPIAFLPLRSLFENKKEKTKEKNTSPSKICGWCGRKAA